MLWFSRSGVFLCIGTSNHATSDWHVFSFVCVTFTQFETMQTYRLAKRFRQPKVALWNSWDLSSEPLDHWCRTLTTEPLLFCLWWCNYVDHVLVEPYWHCWGSGVVFCRRMCRGILWSVWQHAIAVDYVLLRCFFFVLFLCVPVHVWRKVFKRKKMLWIFVRMQVSD